MSLCNDGFPPLPRKQYEIIQLPPTVSDTRRSKTRGRLIGCTCGSTSCWHNHINRPRPHSFEIGNPLLQKFRSVRKKQKQRLCHTYHYRRIPSIPPRKSARPGPSCLLIPPPPPPRFERPPTRFTFRSLGITLPTPTRAAVASRAAAAAAAGRMGANNTSHLANQLDSSASARGRPATPLMGGRNNSALDTASSNGFTFRKRTSGVQLNSTPNKILYSGPGQVYKGPGEGNDSSQAEVRSEGPDPMEWPVSKDASEKKMNSGIISMTPSSNNQNANQPPLPPAYNSLRTYYFPKNEASPMSAHHSQSVTDLSKMREQHLPPPPPQPQPSPVPPPQQHSQQVLFLTYPPSNSTPGHVESSTTGSVNPSVIPSKVFPCQMHFAPVVVQPQHLQQQQQPDLNMVTQPPVPNEIQDDLLRIEMLLELRKYKRALTAQLQAQQRLVQMCGSSGSSDNLHDSNHNRIGSRKNSQPLNRDETESLRNLLVAAEQLHHRQNFSEKRKCLMDIFKILSDTLTDNENEGREGNEQSQHQQPLQLPPPPPSHSHAQQHVHAMNSSPPPPAPPNFQNQPPDPSQPPQDMEKNTTTVWERELEKHLNSSEFINTYMGPHLRAQNDSGHGSVPVPNVDMLRGAINTGDFDVNDKSRSGFPSGLALGVNISTPLPSQFPPNQNPLLAGAAAANATMAAASASVPISHPQNQGMPPQQQQSPMLQRQYQHYHALDDAQLFPERLQNLPPNIMKLLEAKLSGSPTPTFPSFLSDPPTPPPHPHQNNGAWKMFDGDISTDISIYSPQTSNVSPNPPVEQTQNRPTSHYTDPAGQNFESSDNPVEEKPSPYFPGYSQYVKSPRDSAKRKSVSTSGITTPVEQVQKAQQAKTGSGNPMVDVGELENLLSQLPVVSRKQKVEEFAFKTLKSASPVPEAESETSMIPLVSSQGTMATGTGTSRAASSSGRPDTTDMEGLMTETEDDLKNVDTTKMSIKELVNLGRKIYRILSQLNTTPNRDQGQMQAGPVIFDLPSLGFPQLPQYAPIPIIPENSSTGGGGRKDKRKSISQTDAQATILVDYTSGANPTFITGPGMAIMQTKSQPKVNTGGKRSAPVNTPKLFKKIVKPPPTRWTRGGNGMQNQNQRSISSLPSTRQPSRSGHNMKINVEETNFVSSASKQKPQTNFPVLNRFSNNRRTNLKELGPQVNINRRMKPETPYYDIGDPQFSYTNTRSRSTGTGGTTGTSTAGTNVIRRNFILENITKIKNMKKVPDRGLRPKPLPPVKKRYENIPSTIPSRSRSRSLSAPRDEHPTRRSSSVPITPGMGSQARLYSGVPGTGRSSRPSTMSLRSATARSRSPSNVGSNTGVGVRYTKTRIISRVPTEKMVPLPSSLVGRSSSTKKFGQQNATLKRTSMASVAAGSSRAVLRKSRSKTRRVSAQQSVSARSSTTSSTPPANNRRTRSRQGEVGKRGKVRHHHQGNVRDASLKREEEEEKEEIMKSVEARLGDVLLYTDSDQALIRNMVKEEMDEIMQRHVESLLKQKEEEEEERKNKQKHGHNHSHNQKQQEQQQQPQNSHHHHGHGHHNHHHHHHHNHHKKHNDDFPGESDSSTIVASENLTPLYTPPRIYDESLFSLEKWINPDSHSVPVTPTPFTSAKDTPATTANNIDNGMSLGAGTGQGNNTNAGRKPIKGQTVRFSLPQTSPTN